MNEDTNHNMEHLPSQTKMSRFRLRVEPSYCKVCGIPALYSYYGAIVCPSCKMFFKRNASHAESLRPCPFDDHCQIDITNRHTCAHCRLRKCFSVGMQTEMLRSSIGKPNKSASLVVARRPQVNLTTTFNLLHGDQLILNQDQRTLLSNLVHNFDGESGISIAQQFQSEQNILPVKNRFRIETVRQFYASIFSSMQLATEKNRDFLSLSLSNRSRLLRHNVHYTASVAGVLLLQKIPLLEEPIFYSAVTQIFAPAPAAITKNLIKELDPDQTFMKIILASLAFATTNYTVFHGELDNDPIDSKTLSKIQDTYIELAWRYLLYEYNYYEAVRRFSNLVRCLLLVHDAIVGVYDIQRFQELIDTVVERTEQVLHLHQ